MPICPCTQTPRCHPQKPSAPCRARRAERAVPSACAPGSGRRRASTWRSLRDVPRATHTPRGRGGSSAHRAAAAAMRANQHVISMQSACNKVVRRLIEQQQLRRREERLCQSDTHTPSTGHVLCGPISGYHVIGEAQASKDLARAWLSAGGVELVKARVDADEPLVLWAAFLQSDVISGSQLQSDVISGSQLHSDVISGSQLQSDVISGSQLQSDVISGSQLQSDVISGSQLQSDVISGSQLQSDVISGSQLQSAAIVAAIRGYQTSRSSSGPYLPP